MDDDLIQNVLLDDIVSILRALIAAADGEPDPKAVVDAVLRPGERTGSLASAIISHRIAP